MLGLVLLAGCGGARPAGGAPAGAAPATGPGLSLSSSVGAIAADPQGKAILDRDVPGMTSNSNWMLVQGMTLPQLQSLSGGQMTQAELDHVSADLAKLPATGGTAAPANSGLPPY